MEMMNDGVDDGRGTKKKFDESQCRSPMSKDNVEEGLSMMVINDGDDDQ